MLLSSVSWIFSIVLMICSSFLEILVDISVSGESDKMSLLSRFEGFDVMIPSDR